VVDREFIGVLDSSVVDREFIGVLDSSVVDHTRVEHSYKLTIYHTRVEHSYKLTIYHIRVEYFTPPMRFNQTMDVDRNNKKNILKIVRIFNIHSTSTLVISSIIVERHDISEILLTLGLNTNQSINQPLLWWFYKG
jgi:hypothetical protein